MMLEVGCMMLTLCYLGVIVLKVWLAAKYVKTQDLSYRSGVLSEKAASQFTIVQPILSGDPMLESVLKANLETLPGSTNFCWLVDDNDQEAQQITSRLIEEDRSKASRSPSQPSRIQVLPCGSCPQNANPKTFKLCIALTTIKTEYFAVLDDDTKIQSDCLLAAMQSLSHNDLYTGLPIYDRGNNLPSDFVSHFVRNNSVMTYLAPLALFAPLTINGMFYVARTRTLQQLNAFERVQHVLCDDYAIKQVFAQAGLSIHQGTSFQMIATSVKSWRHYFQLMHRWTLFAITLTRDQSMFVRLLLAALLGLPPLVLLFQLTLTVLEPSWTNLGLFASLVVIRHALIYCSHWIAWKQIMPIAGLTSLMVELIQPFHLLHALWKPSIVWRSRTIHVRDQQNFEILRGDLN